MNHQRRSSDLAAREATHAPLTDPDWHRKRARRSGFAAGLLLIGAAVLTMPAIGTSATPPPARMFHIATNGNDGWSGTLAAPNAKRTDGPYASLPRALAALRELKQRQGGALRQPVTMLVHGGLYPLTESVVFTPADSGTAECPVRIEAFKKEVPVFSGGRRVTGWQPIDVAGRRLWMAELPAVREGKWFFRQLWVNGERRHRARHPNRGYLAVEGLIDVKPDAPWTEGQSQFRFKAGDLQAWATATNAEVLVMNRWVESHLPVVSIDADSRVARFGKRSVFKLDPGDLYYVENALELLDQPGEWYLDRAAGRLYYLPRPGENMAQAEAIAPVLAQVARLDGKPDAGQFIEQLHFLGLTFAHTDWYFPFGFDQGKDKAEIWPPPASAVGGFAQAAIGVPGALRAHGLRASSFTRCRFVHLGTYGLDLARGCQSNRVTHCEIGDLGAGGIKLGETAIRDNPNELSRDNEVSDCHIHDGGEVFHSAIGVWVGQSPSNRLVHNLVHDFYYTGFSLGWTWGYDRALATNNLVEFNHVHHIGVRSDGDGPILSDMGGIYTLGLHAGTVIRNNLWHDCIGLRYGGWGIYFDEGTTGIVAENNLVYRTTHGGFHQHYGKDNTVRNNIFIDARNHQIQRSRAENHRSFIFENNLVSWREGTLLDGNFSGTNYLFRSNLYWNVNGDTGKFSEWTFADWQKRGQDTGSIIADPRFKAPARNDYTLPPDSPALAVGFKPFDLRRVGPRSPGRK